MTQTRSLLSREFKDLNKEEQFSFLRELLEGSGATSARILAILNQQTIANFDNFTEIRKFWEMGVDKDGLYRQRFLSYTGYDALQAAIPTYKQPSNTLLDLPYDQIKAGVKDAYLWTLVSSKNIEKRNAALNQIFLSPENKEQFKQDIKNKEELLSFIPNYKSFLEELTKFSPSNKIEKREITEYENLLSDAKDLFNPLAIGEINNPIILSTGNTFDTTVVSELCKGAAKGQDPITRQEFSLESVRENKLFKPLYN